MGIFPDNKKAIHLCRTDVSSISICSTLCVSVQTEFSIYLTHVAYGCLLKYSGSDYRFVLLLLLLEPPTQFIRSFHIHWRYTVASAISLSFVALRRFTITRHHLQLLFPSRAVQSFLNSDSSSTSSLSSSPRVANHLSPIERQCSSVSDAGIGIFFHPPSPPLSS